MAEIQNIITAKEKALIKKIAADIYMPFVKSGKTLSVDLEDLYHLGIIGLLEARKKFNKQKGAKWLTFAAYRVHGAIIDQLRKESIIRIPQEKQQKVKLIDQARRKIAAMKNTPASVEEIADELGWSTDEVHQASIIRPHYVEANMTDHRTDSKESDRQSGEIVVDESSTPEDINTKIELVAVLQNCLKALHPARDRIVLLGRSLEGLKLKDLASSLGCSLENVRQIENKAKEQMKKCLEKSGWSTEGLHIYNH